MNDKDNSKDWEEQLKDFYIKQDDLNRLIMDYLVNEGFKEAAEKFQEESGIISPVDLSTLDNRIMIRESINAGRIQDSISLVNQLHPELLDNDRYLYFHLQQLHLIELIRDGKVEEALRFAQNKIAEAGETNPEVLNELERTLALLAFEKPESSPFSDLLETTHRQKIASELNAAILRMEHKQSQNPRIQNLLKCLLWTESQLEKKNIKYRKMTDLASASFEPKN
ncbi:unnamed protein product [Chironomus riparius]|uniref:Lish motif-containing protein n=1 Tax=Chironomus riparius TaxID=315576 RepID=A0A9N9RKM3_9DIPT|nr:unnamed protein product [Chironomus riparius]